MPDVARHRMSQPLRRLLAFAAFCAIWKLVFFFAPESAVLAQFCRVPAEIAAFYYGVPLDVGTLTFTARGVTLAVTRACAATDFYVLVAAALLTARIMREGVGVANRLRDLLDLLLAWAVTLAVNSLRIIALVPVDAVFPKDHAPIVHLLVGVVFFLPAFALVWHFLFAPRTKLQSRATNHEPRATTHPGEPLVPKRRKPNPFPPVGTTGSPYTRLTCREAHTRRLTVEGEK